MMERKNTIKRLRQKAEKLLKIREDVAGIGSTTEVDNLKLIQELQIHQVELELQNEELQHARAAAEVTNDKYIGPVFNLFLATAFKSNVNESCELSLTTSGNESIFVHLSGIVAGNGAECMVTAVDITEHRHAQQKLQISEEMYHSIFEGSPDGILIADTETKMITYGNTAQCRLFGYTEEQFKTMSIAGIHPEDTFGNTLAEFESVLHGEKTLAENIQCLKRNGEIFYADISGALISINGRTQLLGFFRDITARKITEQNIHDLNVNLEKRITERTAQLAESNAKLEHENAERLESEIKHRSMISNISDVIGIMGTDGVMKYKSPNIEKHFGWKPGDITKLFQPFERIGADKTKTEGTGMGLIVVKELMKAMNGAIGVESEVDVGSTFWIELPLTENRKSYQQQNEENIKLTAESAIANNDPGFQRENELLAVGPGHEKTGTILYIEDSATNAELVEQILLYHRSAIQLVSNENGMQAVSLAIEYAPDLILLDLDLPDIQGFEVIKLLQAEEKTMAIPVVVVSADAMPPQIEKLMKAGSKDYLIKPLDIMAFLEVVDKWVGNLPKVK